MKTIQLCLRCLAPVPLDAPHGLCPACLLQSQPGTTGTLQARVLPIPGETFGGYRIHRLLGRGGMGEVYEAESLAAGRRVALKVMNQALASEKDRMRFLREGRLAAGISHPNVVYIYGSEEISGSPVIAMELVHSGTLKDRIKREGPLPPAQAVDVVLDLIAGLEAAHETGVLHRDIKPANCFIGEDGKVKVGDFGLSISTIARGESLITASGSVLGTPAYASPEQLRGEDLDVASDIYSVGATLYHLLTGHPPHETTDFVKLITEVLDKVPKSPQQVRPEIPAGLSALVMRCLAKNRTARFPSYEALRDALVPFSSTAPSPALLGLRFVAGLVDEFFAYSPSFALIIWMGLDAAEQFFLERNLSATIVLAAFLLWDLLYFAVPEGWWGASIGKAICRLRVVGPDAGPPGLPRALLRALIFRITWTIPVLATLLFYSSSDYAAQMNAEHWNPEDWLWFPLLVVLFCTARRRNGFAGLHDLVSATRVILRPAATRRGLLKVFPATTPAEQPRTQLGPYEIIGSFGSIGEGELFLAHDPALRRNLWIHKRPSGGPEVAARRRDLNRTTRLRWLNGERTADRAWDAYEAPEGAPLLRLAIQPWAAVRFWLHDLAEEFATGREHESLPPAFSLDRVWITQDNRAIILDFPCPGLGPIPPTLPGQRSDDLAGAQQFLNAVAKRALFGTGGDQQSPPPPLHVQPFLHSLAEEKFESPEILVGNLRSLLSKPAQISPLRRLAVIGLALGPALVAAFTIAAVFWLSNLRTSRTWPAYFEGSEELRAELRFYDTFYEHPAAKSARPNEEDYGKKVRRAFRLHLAGHHRDLIANTNFWAQPVVKEALSLDLREVAFEAVTEHPTVDPEKLAEADATVRYLRPMIAAADTELPHWAGFGGFWTLVWLAAILDFIAVLMVGEGLFLRVMGLATVTADGKKVPRWRVFARTLFAWSGAFVGAALSMAVWLMWLPGTTQAIAVWIALVAVALLAAGGIAYAVLHPARGLQDRLAGTWLVAR